MGNFSQDPNARAADAVGKQYVGVRIQQAVPLVDADWNLLDDIRRADVETFGRLYIGNGIPSGSDGFRISPPTPAAPNDFAIAGGVALVNGKTVRNDATAPPVLYSNQPNFVRAGLTPLTTPVTDKGFFVVLDVFEREVDHLEDPALVDARIGVETAVRVKREWAVRVFRDPEDVPQIDAPPAGHVYLRLARLARTANTPTITADVITDLRDTQLTLLRKIEVRDAAGNLVVDNARFQQVLQNTRNNIQALLRYLTTGFNGLFVLLTGAEVLGVQAASHVAHTAEAGLAQLNAFAMSNNGALRFLRQLYDAQENFRLVWRDVVLQLGTSVKKYASYQNFVTRLDERLNNLTVGTLTGLLPAIRAANLAAAVDMQEEIARLIGTAARTIARGSIQVAYVNAPPGVLTIGQTVRFEFRVRSFTTQADTFTVSILPVAGWQRVLVDNAGNPIPNNRVPVGAVGTETTLFVNTTVAAGTSQLQLRVVSDSNPAEIDQVTGLLTLTAGQAAPPGEDRIQFQLEVPFHATIAGGVVTLTQPPQASSVGVRIFNNTGQTATFNITVDEVPNSRIGTWTITRQGDAATAPLAHGASVRVGGVGITPGGDAVSTQARYNVSTTIAGATVAASIVIPISVGP